MKNINLSGSATVLLATALVLSACRGVPTAGEKAQRKELETVTSTFRPEGMKPNLPVLTTNSELKAFVEYALLNNPSVEVAYFDWVASVERITSARSLPDPQLTFQMDIENIVSSVMPGLMVNLPGPGKLRAGAEVATAESEGRYQAFQSAVLESAFAVKRGYYQLYFLREKIRVSQENLKLLTTLEELARAQNEVGKVTLQDVLRAQIEQDRLRTEISNLEDSQSTVAARFNAALGRKPDANLILPGKIEAIPSEVSVETPFQVALSKNNRLKALEAEVRAAEATITLARKAQMPDSSLGVMADVKMSPTLYRPVATVSLPIWRDKIAAQIAEAQARHHSAQAKLTAQEIELVVELIEKNYLYREASRNFTLLSEQLLPKARQSLEVARSGYLAGQIDFFNLTDSERTLLGFELDAVEASAAKEILLAELSLVLQGMSPSSGDTAASMVRASGGTNARRPAAGAMNSMR